MRLLRGRASLLAGLLGSLAACGGDGTGPEPATPGRLSVRLTTPSSDDGAVLFDVSGGPIDSVVAAGYRLRATGPGTSPRRAVVSGSLASGAVASIWVPDVKLVSSYTAIVRDVAARNTYALRDLQGYRMDVIAP